MNYVEDIFGSKESKLIEQRKDLFKCWLVSADAPSAITHPFPNVRFEESADSLTIPKLQLDT